MFLNKYASAGTYVKSKTVPGSTYRKGINENRKGNEKIGG